MQPPYLSQRRLTLSPTREEQVAMHLIQPDPATALLGLRALKTIASASGPVGPAQRAMMEAAQKVILHTHADIDTLAPVTPAELAQGFAASPEIRRQFTNGMIVTAVAD